LSGSPAIPRQAMKSWARAVFASCGLLRKGKGKSGGVRVIYYFHDLDMPVYALLLYGKNERADLTPDERKSVAAFAAAIKATRRRG
jgi:hypothetical protein